MSNIRMNGAPEATTLQLAQYAALKPADGVVVAFGKFGNQYGHCVPRRGYLGTGEKALGVRIWRSSSKSWTKPRLLHPGEVVRRATSGDEDRFKPDFGLAWER